MRLALVTHKIKRGDGQGRVCYEIAKYALEHDNQVTLLAELIQDDLVELGARWIPIQPSIRRPQLLRGREFVARATAVLSQIDSEFDAIQGFGYTLDRPHCVNNCQFVHHAWIRSSSHTFRIRKDPYGLFQWLDSALNVRWERRAFKGARTIVASSELIRNQIVLSGITESKVVVIHNGVDTDEFYPGAVNRRSLGLPESVPLAVFVGDIRTPRKNLDSVLHAMSSVPKLHLAVVGAIERSPYPALADRLCVSDRVTFLGFRNDIPDIMRASDLFVFPSRYEACSLVLLEAMSSGLPVITAATAGGAELISSDAGVVLPDPDNLDDLTRAIVEMLDNPSQRKAMGEAARSIALQNTWIRTAMAHMELYSNLLTV